MAADKTSYTQCLTHMIKGNLGAGMLAMPASFAHSGLVGATVSLPALCLISAYCVHLLIRSAQKVEHKCKGQKFNQDQVNYAKLARGAFELGPGWARRMAEFVCHTVNTCLLVTQIGVCSIYIVFVVGNVRSILASNGILVAETWVFLAVLPVTLMLSSIRTLARLTLASLIANLLQSIGLALIVEYLLRDIDQINLYGYDSFRPLSEMALGFGSIMFAFEGISVVLPLYSRMRRPQLMNHCLGVINISFLVILVLYFIMGLLGYLKFGHQVRDSITLNLPATPLYDAVRAMFTASILLSYPLQFYVPNEIIWSWAKKALLSPAGRRAELRARRNQTAPVAVRCATDTAIRGSLMPMQLEPPMLGPLRDKSTDTADSLAATVKALETALPPAAAAALGAATPSKLSSNLAQFVSSPKAQSARATITNHRMATAVAADPNKHNRNETDSGHSERTAAAANAAANAADYEVPPRYEYYCRLTIVLLTFTIAISVPKLNLLMDLIGSFSGAALCLTLPAIIHLVAFWDDTKGFAKVTMILVDGFIIVASACAGLGGSLSSLVSIVSSFQHPMPDGVGGHQQSLAAAAAAAAMVANSTGSS